MPSYTEADIVYEEGDYWVLRVPCGKSAGTFEVYRNGFTHSTRCAVIGFRGGGGGLTRAKAEVARRIALGDRAKP